MARSLRCPRCSTVITVAEGQTPVCPSCGFGGPAPAIRAAPPAAPAPYAPSATGSPHAAGAPPMPLSAPAQPRQRPGSVTFLAVIVFIQAGFMALAGLALTLGGTFFGALLADLTAEAAVGALVTALFLVVGVVFLALAVLEFFIARGLLRGRNWARITQIVLSFIGCLLTLGALAVGNFTGVLSLALNIAAIVILFGRNAKAYFEPILAS